MTKSNKGIITLLALQKRSKKRKITKLVCPVCDGENFKKEQYSEYKDDTLLLCKKCKAILDCWDYVWYKKAKDFPTKPLMRHSK